MNNDETREKIEMHATKEINLFPTQIWVFPPDEKMITAIQQMEAKALSLRESTTKLGTHRYSARGNWSMPSPHLDPDFKQAIDRIELLLEAACKRLDLPDGKRRINTWLNVNDPGSYQRQHEHNPNTLSGLLYLSDIQKNGRLIFKDPRPARQYQKETQRGPIEVPVSAIAGGAAIFPSWLEHYVEENKTSKTTACIGFNMLLIAGEG